MTNNSTHNQPTGQTASGKRSKLRFLIPLALVLTVALVACGSNAGNGSSSTSVFAGLNSASSGSLAPDFPITIFQGQDVVGGQEINFSDLLGERPVILNFWAGLCPPCRAELPDLQEFHEKFEDRALMLGIDLGQTFGLGSQQDAQDLLDELGITYPAGSPDDGSVIKDYKIFGIPATVFIDADGKIFETWSTIVTAEILEETTLAMLNQ